VEEDTQAFVGREETVVEEVELVIILHQELKPCFVAARGAHRLRRWERRHVGGKRGGIRKEKSDLQSCTRWPAQGEENPPELLDQQDQINIINMIRSIVDEGQPLGPGSVMGKVEEAPIRCWGTQIQRQQPGSCVGGKAHLKQAGIMILREKLMQSLLK